MSLTRLSSKHAKEPPCRQQHAATLASDKSQSVDLGVTIPLLFTSSTHQSVRILHTTTNTKIEDVRNSPRLTIDVQKYDSLLDQGDFSSEQKAEALQALWTIIIAFVELGFGVSPTEEVNSPTLVDNLNIKRHSISEYTQDDIIT